MNYLDTRGHLKKAEVMTDRELWSYVKETLEMSLKPPSKDSDLRSVLQTHERCARVALLCLKELRFRMKLRK